MRQIKVSVIHAWTIIVEFNAISILHTWTIFVELWLCLGVLKWVNSSIGWVKNWSTQAYSFHNKQKILQPSFIIVSCFPTYFIDLLHFNQSRLAWLTYLLQYNQEQFAMGWPDPRIYCSSKMLSGVRIFIIHIEMGYKSTHLQLKVNLLGIWV